MSGGGGAGGGGSGSPNNTEWRFNQTLRNVQGMLKGRSFPGKVLLTRRSEPLSPPDYSPRFESDRDEYEQNEGSQEGKGQASGNTTDSMSAKKSNLPSTSSTNSLPDAQGLVSGARATDSARIAKFTNELSRPAVILDKLRELSWSGVPPYMRPKVWRLLLGYAPPNADRREGVLTRKRLEYVECVSQYYDIPDSERSDEEINMLRQIAVDCPRTVPDVTFFQHPQIQKSLERILYTWAIRHPASGYVQEPVSKHIEEQGLDFLQFAFRWFNCLLIREIPFHLVTRLWDTYLAEGDYLPDFLVYISASFLLTWSDKLKKLDFQEMVMFLQHLPTRNWAHHELEMVLSRAYMWHTMFKSSPSHLAN
uniref:Rab-GAP TBC domain-containing protein n=1 Tax=Leersia perrieri TaxID=77586 RepID=A0A0D9XFM9_9ORYZ